MRVSENRILAWCTFAFCVLLSVLLSGGMAMRDMRLEARQVFYEGVAKNGAGIDRDLDERAENARMLAENVARFVGESPELIALREACDVLLAADEIELRHAAYLQLESAVDACYAQVEALLLSDDERRKVGYVYREICAQSDMIRRDPYNMLARDFNESIAKFPAYLIAGMTGIDKLQFFE